MRVAAWFSPKIQLGVEGRKNLLQKLETVLPGLIKGRPVAWFHAASLGEFEQGRPVMETYRKEYPDHFILLTFFSPSGYEIRKNYAGADYICYLPIDTRTNAQTFVRIVNPQIAFFIKYEFWYNYLVELKNRNVYVFSFSTIFRAGQVFFNSYGGFYRKLLTYFDYIFVQNQESVDLLQRIGMTRFALAGDTRFDRVAEIAAQTKNLPVIDNFVKGQMCLVAGSVWGKDMEVLIPALNALKQPVKVIIAPHEIKADEIENWRKQLSGSSVLYSVYKETNGEESFDYLFIDNIGMLSSLYRYGNMAFIGGSFGSGLHNILEAATFGLPVIFGNKGYHKFQEAVDLVKLGGAKIVSNSTEIVALLENWMIDAELLSAEGAVSRRYVEERKGATEKVMKEVRKLLV
ncbi:3-deoxy-D-manno-octulosonic acid transferase [Dyadobacter psychrotolerans]|uniref:3-deoxy-D-manno-octulosonic acid transferase n=2 Tax=Dyadobacter psychrotolerans TaxID=2541721 RepID=A0A4R5DLT4_9BACT|nr:3-deoxy-D-manno-octulosonic acid transferase [Dyadobacter psychrotolerans]